MNSTVGPAVRAALGGLIDYAGLFPPATLAMEAAVAEYAGCRRGAAAWMLGAFIVPASRLAQLAQAWTALSPAARLTVSVILDVSPEPRQWFASLQDVVESVARSSTEAPVRVGALEVALPRLLSARETYDAAVGQLHASIDRAGLGDRPVYAELPADARRSEVTAGAMAALARTRMRAKVRCGGVTPEAFPSVEDLAAFLSAAAAEGVAFKATAGLHHPLRRRDPASGFVMHGFLNLLAAAAFARTADAGTLARILAEEDPAAFTFDDSSFAWRELRADTTEIERMRAEAFNAYGSCSFSEPVDDLTALGLLPAVTA